MSGRLVLVTGATSGIGRATAFELARRGLRVIVHGRDAARLDETVEHIGRETGVTPERALADFSSLAEVRSLAEDVTERFGALDVLINNAGLLLHRRRLTPDGLETTFAVNTLAPFLLTRLLLPALDAAAPSRIVNVSSAAHRAISRVDFDDLQSERHYGGYRAYALSKLGNILVTYGQAERLDAGRTTCNCLHPGTISTKLLHAGLGFGGAPVEKGARVPVHLATSEDVEGVTGRYFTDEEPTLSSPLSYDEDLRERFWTECERLIETARTTAR